MKAFFVFSSCLLLHSVSAQTFSSVIADAKTKAGIPYATVQYGENNGVVTNEEGRFSFTLAPEAKLPDSIYISSMGYEKVGFVLDQLKKDTLTLPQKAIELSSVYVFDKPLSVDEIMDMVEDRLSENVNNAPLRQRYFLRESELGNIQKLDMGFEKSSIAELDKELIDSIAASIPRNSPHYTETLGDLYKKGDALKVNVIKAAELYDKEDIGSFEELGKRMEDIFKANVKPDSYLKIKSGLFSQKIQVEEVMEELETDKETMEKAEALEQELLTDSVPSLLKAQKHLFKELLSEMYHHEDATLDVLRKTRRYDFELIGYTDIDASGVYVISFHPSRRGNFKGKLYVNIEDFAVMRIDFENLENLSNFRLLGIYYRERLYKGSMHFGKLPNDRYALKFAQLSFGNWFRFDRPLDVIEKNKNVKGRRKQNELRLNIDFRMDYVDKWEFIAFESSLISQEEFKGATENKNAEATYMPNYDPAFWQGHTIMEPNSVIREFSVDRGNP